MDDTFVTHLAFDVRQNADEYVIRSNQYSGVVGRGPTVRAAVDDFLVMIAAVLGASAPSDTSALDHPDGAA